ncbi:hypothetical protein [Rhodococcus koreensis]|uniref:hypothetical protein n=1 Tax=Rhodococcus koreensis TaxID=99653 RepID=UPI0036717BB0
MDAPTGQLVAVLEAPEADGAVFCTHGDGLDALAEPARARGAAWVPPAASTAKGGAWIVDRGDGPTLRDLAPTPSSSRRLRIPAVSSQVTVFVG